MLFTIPTKEAIVARRSFTNTGTFDIPGESAAVTYTSTVVGGGTAHVTVPAGSFDAYRLNLTISRQLPKQVVADVTLFMNFG